MKSRKDASFGQDHAHVVDQVFVKLKKATIGSVGIPGAVEDLFFKPFDIGHVGLVQRHRLI